VSFPLFMSPVLVRSRIGDVVGISLFLYRRALK